MVRFEEVSGVLVVRIEGRLDNRTTPLIEEEVVARLQGGATRLAFDLSGVTYVASVGLRLILLVAKRLKQAKGAYALFGLQPSVVEVFEISGFLGMLTIRDDEASAVAAVQG